MFACDRDKEKGLSPHIVNCERLTVNEDGEQCLYGCWFLRPNETFHLATRKFLQKVGNLSWLPMCLCLLPSDLLHLMWVTATGVGVP